MPDINIKLPNMQNLVPAMDVELSGLNNMDMGPMVMMGPGFSGAIVESLGPQLAQYFGAKDGVGVLVKEVRKDSPAGKSGMKAGDVIISAAGQPVSGRGVWDHVLWDNRGKPVSVQILREKRPVTISLHVPEKTEGRLTPQNFAPGSFQIDAGDLPRIAQLTQQEEAAMQQEIAQAQQEMNSSELKQQMEQAKLEAEKAAAQINSPEFKEEFKKQMEQARAEIAKAQQEINSPKFKQQMEEAGREAQKAAAQINTDEFKKQMEQARAEVAKAQQEMNSPEFKKQMEEAQEQIRKAQHQIELQMTPMD